MDRDTPMAEMISIEVAFALPEKQAIVSVTIADGATVGEAIAESAICAEFPAVDIDSLQAGVWGHPVERSACVRNGDRVELYRPLLRDPRDARRELAQSGLTMREQAD